MPRLFLKLQPQLQSEWCWAAIAASISRHYDPDSPWCQCKLATRMTGNKNCCSNPHSCNRPQYLEKALRMVGRLAGPPAAGPLTFGRVQKEILAGRPVCARIGWPGSTIGHFILIYGCAKSRSGNQWLYVEDPLYGSSTWLYSELCRNYQYAGGRWSYTYPIQGKHAAS
jgi:Papain-like cysteine protease AvrRpt2